MEFIKYQHVERLGTIETDGILNGMCYVFPKIDGTNASLWINDGVIQAGSRNRELSVGADNAGFFEWSHKQTNLKDFFKLHPNLRLYGEWLVPHTLKTYEDSAWNKFYVFDVMSGDKYLHYDEYSKILDGFDIEYIPPICKVENPTIERLYNQLEKNGYLIKDGEGIGEGIVIKNYDYKNRFGRVTWAKIVRNEFKSKHAKKDTTEIRETLSVEEMIVDKFVTEALVRKEYAKIESENGWCSKFIPRLLNTVYYCLVKEDCWNFIKEHKNPTIDFKRLLFFCNNRVKKVLPEIF